MARRRRELVRQPHWITPNHAERFPGRWIAWDTEAYRQSHERGEDQKWRLGAACYWRTDGRSAGEVDQSGFSTPEQLWEWVTERCTPGRRTVAWCHNLGYDIRTSRMLEILPALGWELDWWNLGESVSTVVWKGPKGTLVFCDLFTWLPVDLRSIGGMVGLPKAAAPHEKDSHSRWEIYCVNDVEIVRRAVVSLVGWLKDNHAGNWQATGAGQMYAMWRHRFLDSKLLVHADDAALAAERDAMHTGRAEAWRHGTLHDGPYTEIDMRMAYCQIAADCEVPLKLKFHDRRVSIGTYRRLSVRYRCLARVRVSTALPLVPCRVDDRTIWPTGEFETTLWDTEINLLLERDQGVEILEMWRYTKGPALRSWALWCLDVCRKDNDDQPLVVKTWVKHGSRALIGRIALRTRQWHYFGYNADGYNGTSLLTDSETGQVSRLMHCGDQILIEDPAVEADSSCPQITSWIMSECRARLWGAMEAAGTENIAHVDTDSLIVRSSVLSSMKDGVAPSLAGVWLPKGSWKTISVHGPRNFRLGAERRASGVPRSAKEPSPNHFQGERWESLSTALSKASGTIVRVFDTTWVMKRGDTKRDESTEDSSRTVARAVS